MWKLKERIRRFFTPNSYIGAVDVPDNRDYIAESPRRAKLPKEINLFKKTKLKFDDQGQTNRCTAYALTKCKKIHDSLEDGKVVPHDPVVQWQEQLKTGASEGSGDTLQNALKSLVRLHWSNRRVLEYRRIQRPDKYTVKRWLVMGHPVFTGVDVRKDGSATNFSWSSIRKGIVDLVKGYVTGGHAIAITGYIEQDGKEYFICQNSWGAWGYGKEGQFLVDCDQVGQFFSMYILFDAIDR